MKIFAALGPGDIVGAHRLQMAGKSVNSETSIIYSGQLIEYCRVRGIKLLALSQNNRVDSLDDGDLRLENRPFYLDNAGGLMFHISWILRGFYLAYRAKRFGAQYALINSGSAHYFSLSVFKLLGIPVAVDFHNALWPAGAPERELLNRIVRRLDGLHFRWFSSGTIGVSDECGRQVKQIAGREVPFFGYKCQFRSNEFSQDSLREPMEDGYLRIAFAGRLEENKGVFDLLTIADSLKSYPVKIDICGAGPALDELQRRARDLTNITVHGALDRPSLQKIYRQSDAVIVPTRSSFAEGMPKVCAEATLCGLAIITSRLTNALDALRPAIIEVNPDDPASYAEAIKSFISHPDRIKDIRLSCAELTPQFFDRSNSLAAAFDRLLAVSFDDWKPLDSYDAVFAKIV